MLGGVRWRTVDGRLVLLIGSMVLNMEVVLILMRGVIRVGGGRMVGRVMGRKRMHRSLDGGLLKVLLWLEFVVLGKTFVVASLPFVCLQNFLLAN